MSTPDPRLDRILELHDLAGFDMDVAVDGLFADECRDLLSFAVDWIGKVHTALLVQHRPERRTIPGDGVVTFSYEVCSCCTGQRWPCDTIKTIRLLGVSAA